MMDWEESTVMAQDKELLGVARRQMLITDQRNAKVVKHSFV
jgi:hypothetical protein